MTAVSREVHLHNEAGDVPAAVDTVQLWAERQVVEVYSTLGGADSQITRIGTKPGTKAKAVREAVLSNVRQKSRMTSIINNYKKKHRHTEIFAIVPTDHATLSCRTPLPLPYILNRRAPVPFLAPDFK